MSYQAVAAILDLHECSPIECAVFVAIAERADAAGKNSRPTVAEIARRSKTTRNTARAAIERGVEGGILIARPDRGWDVEILEPRDIRKATRRGKAGLSKARAAQRLSTDDCSTFEHQRAQRLSTDRSTVEHVTTPPPLTTILTLVPPVAERSVEDGFEQWWKVYPRRTAKGAAKKAWIRTAGVRPSLDAMLAATEAFAAERVGQNPKFTPYPATWLNAERWADERERGPRVIVDEETGQRFIDDPDEDDGIQHSRPHDGESSMRMPPQWVLDRMAECQ